MTTTIRPPGPLVPEIENGITRREFLTGAGSLFILGAAGCSGRTDGGEQATAETRTVKHAMGETEVPVNPERVVVLDTGVLDSAITLGVKPVGAAETIPGEGFPSYLEDETEGIEKVGTNTEPNLEKIATLEPDLILSSKLRLEQVYDQLSQLAPTVFTETTGVTWRENFQKHAGALNKEAEAEEVVNEYEARIEEFRQAMGDRLDGTEVSVVRFTPGDTRIYQKESFIGTVLDDAGLPRPESQDVEEFTLMNVSAEFIPKMGGDVIFVTVYGAQEDTRHKRRSPPIPSGGNSKPCRKAAFTRSRTTCGCSASATLRPRA